MISLTLSVRQCDCPLTAASKQYPVRFVTPHWHYDQDRSTLELRLLAEGKDATALSDGLGTIRNHEETNAVELLAKQDRTARVRLTMGTTAVMGTVVDHDGYLTGPFENAEGTEQWEIGFDHARTADEAVAALRAQADHCELRERRRLKPERVLESVRSNTLGSTVLDGEGQLTATERRTIQAAVQDGYYDTPRGTTLAGLAADLEVSDAAVSKTLRRAERKLLVPTITELESVRRWDQT